MSTDPTERLQLSPQGPPHTVHTGRVHLQPTSPPADNGRAEYDITIMQPGLVLRADGGDSNWLIPSAAIEAAAPLFDGIGCYLDHPELLNFWGDRGEPQVKNLVGVVADPHWDPLSKELRATLRLYDEQPQSPGSVVAALLDQMLADHAAGLQVPPIGLSAVFFHTSIFDEDEGLRITQVFNHVESVDLVYAPGAGGYVRQALAAIRPPTDSTTYPIPERSSTMPEELQTQDPPEMTQEEAVTRLHQVSEQLAAMTARAEAAEAARLALQASPAGETTPPTQDPAPDSGENGSHSEISALVSQMEALTAVVSAQQETRTIAGMGQAPRERVTLGPTGLDEIQSAWDWIFGVEDAATPPPDLRRTDRLYYLLSGDGDWHGVFNERAALAAANATTLAGMVVNAMNKVIVPLYNRLDVYRWFEQIVSVQPTDGSLHDMAWIQFGGIGDLPVVADGAAYTELTVGDSKEADSFVKYGGYVGITEKVIRNSDIAKIQAIPRALTIAAVQTRSAKIASIFTANSGVGPTLDQDSVALFHTVSHGNLATTPYSITAWKAARLECYKQTELTSAKRQGVWPKFWLGPADLYDEALIDFGYGAGAGGYTGTADNDVNPYAMGRPGDPRPIPIAVPDFTDANDWGYVADPVVAPVIQMAYADNPGGGQHPAPSLYMVTSPTAGLMFTNDVLPIKVRDFFAYGVATYRGIGKRNVT